jgi:hypothetical protein
MGGLISKPKGKEAILQDYLNIIENIIKNGNSSREEKIVMISNITITCIDSLKD